MKAVAIALAVAFAAPVASTLSGHYEGQVPFILDMNLIFPGDGTMNFDQNVKVAKIEIKCPTEKIAETASGVTFPNIATTGDCMGDALRKQKKDVTKFTIDINSDGSLTFHSDGWPDLKLTKKTVASAGGELKITWQDCGGADTDGKVTDVEPKEIAIGSSSTLTGTGTLSKAETGGTFAITAKASVLTEHYTGNICEGKTFDLPLNLGKVVWQGMACPIAAGPLTVKIGFSMASSIPASLASATIAATATATNGDKVLCLNAQIAKAESAGNVGVAALSGHYEGSVPFILDMNLIFPGDGTMNFDQNVKVAKIEIKCPTEKIAETASGVTFPNIATTGDCMGDALRKQKKDVTKFTIDINSDGSLTFHSDGWPDLKLTKKTMAAIMV